MEIYYPSRSLRSAKSPFLIGKVTYITYEQAIFQSYVQSPEAVYRPIYLNLLSECFLFANWKSTTTNQKLNVS